MAALYSLSFGIGDRVITEVIADPDQAFLAAQDVLATYGFRNIDWAELRIDGVPWLTADELCSPPPIPF